MLYFLWGTQHTETQKTKQKRGSNERNTQRDAREVQRVTPLIIVGVELVRTAEVEARKPTGRTHRLSRLASCSAAKKSPLLMRLQRLWR